MGVPSVEDVADFEGALNAFRRSLEEEEDESNLAEDLDGESSAPSVATKADLVLGDSQLWYKSSQEEWDVEAGQEDWGNEEDVMDLSGMDLDEAEPGISGQEQVANGLVELRGTGGEEIGELNRQIARNQTESTELVQNTGRLRNDELPILKDVGLEGEGVDLSVAELAEGILTGRGADVLEADAEIDVLEHDEDRGQRLEEGCEVGGDSKAAGTMQREAEDAGEEETSKSSQGDAGAEKTSSSSQEDAGVKKNSQEDDEGRDQQVEKICDVGVTIEAAGETNTIQKDALLAVGLSDVNIESISDDQSLQGQADEPADRDNGESRIQDIEQKLGGNIEAAGETSARHKDAEDALVAVELNDVNVKDISDDLLLQGLANECAARDMGKSRIKCLEQKVGGNSEAAGETSTMQKRAEDALVAVGLSGANMKGISEDLLLQGQPDVLAHRDKGGSLTKDVEQKVAGNVEAACETSVMQKGAEDAVMAVGLSDVNTESISDYLLLQGLANVLADGDKGGVKDIEQTVGGNIQAAHEMIMREKGGDFALVAVELSEVDTECISDDLLLQGLAERGKGRSLIKDIEQTVGGNMEGISDDLLLQGLADELADRDKGGSLIKDRKQTVGVDIESAGETSSMQKGAEDALVAVGLSNDNMECISEDLLLQGQADELAERHKGWSLINDIDQKVGGNIEAAGETSTRANEADDALVAARSSDFSMECISEDRLMQGQANELADRDEGRSLIKDLEQKVGGNIEVAGETSTMQNEADDALVAVGFCDINMECISDDLLLQGQADELADRGEDSSPMKDMEQKVEGNIDAASQMSTIQNEADDALVAVGYSDVSMECISEDLLLQGQADELADRDGGCSPRTDIEQKVDGNIKAAGETSAMQNEATHPSNSGKIARAMEDNLSHIDLTCEDKQQRVEKYVPRDLDVQAHEAVAHQSRLELPRTCSHFEDGHTVTGISSSGFGVDSEDQAGGSSGMEGVVLLRSSDQAYGALNLLASVSQVVGLDSINIVDKVSGVSETLISSAHILERKQGNASSTGAVLIVASPTAESEVLSEKAVEIRASQREEVSGPCVSGRTSVCRDDSEQSSRHYQHFEHHSYVHEKRDIIGGTEGAKNVRNDEPSTAGLEISEDDMENRVQQGATCSLLRTLSNIATSDKSEGAISIGTAPSLVDTVQMAHEETDYSESFRIDTGHLRVRKEDQSEANVSEILGLQDMLRLEGDLAISDGRVAERSDVIMGAAVEDNTPSMYVHNDEEQKEGTSVETEMKQGFSPEDHFMAEGYLALQQDSARLDELAKAAVLRRVFGDIDETILSTDGEDEQSTSASEDERVSAVDGPEEHESALNVPDTYGTDIATTSLSGGEDNLDHPNDMTLRGSADGSGMSSDCTKELVETMEAVSPRHSGIHESRNAALPVLGRNVESLSGKAIEGQSDEQTVLRKHEAAGVSAWHEVRALNQERRDMDEYNLVAAGFEGQDGIACNVPLANGDGSPAANVSISTSVPYYEQLSGDSTCDMDLSLTVGLQDNRVSTKPFSSGQGAQGAPGLQRVNSRSMMEKRLPGDDDFDTNLSLHVGFGRGSFRKLSLGASAASFNTTTSKGEFMRIKSPTTHLQAEASPQPRDGRDMVNWEGATMSISSSQFFSQEGDVAAGVYTENVVLTRKPASEGATCTDISDADLNADAEYLKRSYDVLCVADTFPGNYDAEGGKSGAGVMRDPTSENEITESELPAIVMVDEISESPCRSRTDRDLLCHEKVIGGSAVLILERTPLPPCTSSMSSVTEDVLVVPEADSERLGDFDLANVTIEDDAGGRDVAPFRKPPNLNLSPGVELRNRASMSFIFHQEVEDISGVDKVMSMSGILDEERSQEDSSGATSTMPVGILGTSTASADNGLVSPSAPDDCLLDILLSGASTKASAGEAATKSLSSSCPFLPQNVQFDPKGEKADNIELANVHAGEAAPVTEMANTGNMLAGAEGDCIEMTYTRSYPVLSVAQELQAAPDAEGHQYDIDSSIPTAADGAAIRNMPINGRVDTESEGPSEERKPCATSSHVLSMAECIQVSEADCAMNDGSHLGDGAGGTDVPSDIEPTLGNTRVYSELRALMDLVKAQKSPPKEVKSLSEGRMGCAAFDATPADSGDHVVGDRELERMEDVPLSGIEECVDPVDQSHEETGEQAGEDCSLSSFQSKVLVVDLCSPTIHGERLVPTEQHAHDWPVRGIQDGTMSSSLTNQQGNCVSQGAIPIVGVGSSADVPHSGVPVGVEAPTISQGTVVQTVEETVQHPTIDLNTSDISQGLKTRGRKRGTAVQPRKRAAKEPLEVTATNGSGGQQTTRTRRRTTKDAQVASSGTGSVEQHVPFVTWAPPINLNWNPVEISNVQEKPKVRLKVLARKGTQLVQGQHSGTVFTPGRTAPALAQPIAIPVGSQPYHFPFYPHPPATLWPMRLMDPGIIASSPTPATETEGPCQTQTEPPSADRQQLPVHESGIMPSATQPGHSNSQAGYNLPPPPLGWPFAPRLEPLHAGSNQWVLPSGPSHSVPQEPTKRKPRQKAQAPAPGLDAAAPVANGNEPRKPRQKAQAPAPGLDAAAPVANGNEPRKSRRKAQGPDPGLDAAAPVANGDEQAGADGPRKRQRRTPATGEINFSQLQQDVHRVRSIISRRLEAWGSHSNLLQEADAGGEKAAGDRHLIFDEQQREEFVQRMVTSCQANPRMRALFLGAVRRLADYTVMKTAASKSPCEAADEVLTAWEHMKSQPSANAEPFYKLCKAVDKLHNEGSGSLDQLLASEDPEFGLLNRTADGKWDLRIPPPVGKAPRRVGNNAETNSATPSPPAS